MLTSRITEGENRHFKTNTDLHNGDLNLCCFFFVFCFFLVVRHGYSGNLLENNHYFCWNWYL